MSNRVYRLLRNNREEGPFTKEELIQQRLKPYDLIWIDGRSAAWNYPGELAEFKVYAPLPGENRSAPTPAHPQISAAVQAAVAINDLAAPAPKPRYRVSAAWSKVQTATAPPQPAAALPQKKSYPKMVEPQHADVEPAKALSWEEAWHDWEIEKTATPATAPGKAAPAKPSAKKEAELETKYSASLDDLKDQYINHILDQQRQAKKHKVPAFLFPTLALLIICGAGYWLLRTTPASSGVTTTSAQPLQAATEKPVVSPAVTPPATPQPGSVAQVQVAPAITADAVKERKPAALSGRRKQEPAVQPQKSRAGIEDLGAFVQQVKAVDSVIGSKSTTTNNGAANSVPFSNRDNQVIQHTEAPLPAATKPHVKTPSDYVQVPQRITLTSEGATLAVKNISGVNLDLVVIDVQYFDGGNTYRKGETMYLQGLRAGKSTLIKTPKDTNAVYAIAKVSLVTADAANISVVGEH